MWVTKKVKPTNIFLASRRRHGLMSYLDKPLPKHDKTMKLYFSFLNFSSFFCIAWLIFLSGMYEGKKSLLLLSQFLSQPAVPYLFVNWSKMHCQNISTTPVTAMWYPQCLPFSGVHLISKHCWKTHCRNGVVDTFGHWHIRYKIVAGYFVMLDSSFF